MNHYSILCKILNDIYGECYANRKTKTMMKFEHGEDSDDGRKRSVMSSPSSNDITGFRIIKVTMRDIINDAY